MSSNAATSIQQKALANALAFVAKAAKNTSSLPVFTTIKVEIDGEVMTLTATNLERTHRATLLTLTGEGKGGICLPAKQLTDLVATLGQDVSIVIKDDKPEALISSGNCKTTIKGIEAGEFPSCPTPEGEAVEIDFAAITAGLVPAVSEDDARPTLQGINLRSNGSLKAAATDGFRLAVRKSDTVLPKADVIVPADAVAEAAKLSAPVTVIIGENSVLFKAGEREVISQVISGKYPDYETIFDSVTKQVKGHVIVSRKDLLTAIRQAKVIAREGNTSVNVCVNATGTDKKVTLFAQSESAGETTAEVPASDSVGEVSIHLNTDYFKDAVDSITGNQVRVDFGAANTPVLVSDPDDHQAFCQVVMPMHVG